MNTKVVIGVAILAFLMSACGANAGESPITPAPDRPTFLYFYTDG